MAQKNWKELTEAEKRWIWDIHKEADTLLHSRLQLFIAFQAILLAAYFTNLALIDDEIIKSGHAIVIAGVAILAALGFVILSQRLVGGILRLKQFLIGDEFYEIFYESKYPNYLFARALPLLLFGFWVSLLAIKSGLLIL